MQTVSLISSPGASYRDQIIGTIERAQHVVLVTAFASPSGIEEIAPALRTLLARPGTSARVIVAVDRRGFNMARAFSALLALRGDAGKRFSLGIVPEEAGLLHAKALFAKGPQGVELLVGSANLTTSALRANHELALLVDQVGPDLESAFLRFEASLAPQSLDGANADEVLRRLGLLEAERARTARTVTPAESELRESVFALIAEQGPMPALALPATDHIRQWVEGGYLVGRGRRGTDALVIRLPLDNLEKRGLLRPTSRQVLGEAARESRSAGYSIELVRASEAELIRREARRVTSLVSRLSLNLPCFGLWMPASYWDCFQEARARITAGEVLAPERIRRLAEEQRAYLEKGGVDESLGQILVRLRDDGAVEAKHEGAVLDELRLRTLDALRNRTPDAVAEAIHFRTARQRWAPYEQTERPHRQVMVDVVQAALATAYRTGTWPSRFRSVPARELNRLIRDRIESAGRVPDGAAALEILETARTWEAQYRPMDDVVAEFRRIVPDEVEFLAPEVEELLAEASQEGGDDGDDA